MNLAYDSNKPHRRFNPLTGEWVLVSPHRTLRPWQGKLETSQDRSRVRYDPECYLCPGNRRANNQVNPHYATTFVFDNDFPALLPAGEEFSGPPAAPGQLIVQEPVAGRCRVICFSPRHDVTIPLMTAAELEGVVAAWVAETVALESGPSIAYVQVFENKGELMGCSNPHPHCQVWASSTAPNQAAVEDLRQRDYWLVSNSCLLCSYLDLELRSQERIVCQNEEWVALVPFWAVWPFETILIPTRHFAGFPDLLDSERRSLADILKRLTARYDNLFETSFPYSMGFHQRLTNGEPSHWHFHAHFYPPLLRSATVRKFMVGYEMLGTPQRDLTAETAAARLRALAERHYRER